MATAVAPNPQPVGKKANSVSYESFAPRSTAQVSRLSRLAALTAGPIAQDATATTTTLMTLAPPSMASIVYPTSNSNNDGAHRGETTYNDDQAQAKVIAQLQSQLKHTTSCRMAINACSNICEDILQQHNNLIRHSSELSAAADRLQEEAAMLTQHASVTGKPLEQYDAVDKNAVAIGVLFKGTATVRGLSKVKVDDMEEFEAVMVSIDTAVVYFGNECGGKSALEHYQREQAKRKSSEPASGSLEYFRRALALQEAALELIKQAVAERISTVTQQIAVATAQTNAAIAADQLEASLIYTRFHGIASRSNRLLNLVQRRVQQQNNLPPDIRVAVVSQYLDLLAHCRQTYCTSRDGLLQPVIRKHLDALVKVHGAVGMTRIASVFLIRLCDSEISLYQDFFEPVKSKSSQLHGDFQTFLTNLCSSLHKTVRRSIVNTNDLDTLCQIVSILREERTSATAIAAARAISAVVQDAEERLIFCANSTLTKSVLKYKPSASDVDYPNKLLKLKKSEPTITTTTGTSTAEAAAAALPSSSTSSVEDQLQLVYETWFPPLQTVLKILSKIFRVVEPRVFEDMALQSVQSCTRSLQEGAVMIRHPLHADLFLVKHLLILREQLSPFDIELRSVERQLDFSDAGKAVARFLANRNRRVFSMSSNNALVTLLREGVSVQESSVDSKRDLEDALRTACNTFIDHAARSIAGDMMDQASALKVHALSHASSLPAAAEEPSSASLPSSSAGPSTDQVTAVLEALVVDSSAKMKETMAEVKVQLALYLDNPATQSILLKPVARKITRALEDVRKYLPDDARVAELSLAVEQVVKVSLRVAK